MSLRAQVTAMFGLGALVLSIVLGVITMLLVYPVMLEQRQRTTERQSAINARTVEGGLRTGEVPAEEILQSLDGPIRSYSLVHVNGRWHSSQRTVDETDLPTGLRDAAEQGRDATQRVSLPAGPSLVVVRHLPRSDAGYVEVFTLADITQTTRVLKMVLIAAGSVTTVLGVLVGWWAAIAALRPVNVLTEAAAAVAAGNLGVRVEPGRAADLRTLGDAFNRTVSALQRRVERDTRFAANVSHELRSPLMTMVNAVELLQARRDDLPPATGEVVDLLTDEVRRFERTVVDLLEISTAPDSSFVTEPLNLADLVRHAADTAAGRPVTEVPSDDAGTVITGDKRRLERVVANLVDNAQRHGSAVTRVAVEPDTDTVRILVEDCGPGVPPEQRERIFERFTRGDSGQPTSGAGLGLALVAEHVHRHAGRIWVEDCPGGQGARFVVELPRSPDAAHSLPHSPGQP